MSAEGVEALSAAPYASAGRAADYPLSSRFDESDSYVVFDNVFVPWERVFIYRNVELSRDQWRKTPSHLLGNHQAQTRYVTKLRFMAGLAQRMNEMTGNVANPAVTIMMGELVAFVSIYEAMLHAHETMGTIEDGVFWPSRTAYLRGNARCSRSSTAGCWRSFAKWRARLSSRCHRRTPISAIPKSRPTSSATCRQAQLTRKAASS